MLPVLPSTAVRYHTPLAMCCRATDRRPGVVFRALSSGSCEAGVGSKAVRGTLTLLVEEAQTQDQLSQRYPVPMLYITSSGGL